MGHVVLLSGGIDSLVCAEMARQAGELAACVFVDYGHPAQLKEGWKAFAYCGSRGIHLKAVHAFGMDLGDMSARAGARVVRNRNAILLSLAANAMPGALVIGATGGDQADYEDCRPSFFRAMSQALGRPVLTPIIDWTKGEIVARAQELGLRRDDAWSCYEGGAQPCGACPSCASADAAWGAL